MAKRLGKGLDAFFTDLEDSSEETIQEIAIDECRPNPYQPRKTFQADSIEELKESILEYGIIQPIIARKSIKGYEIVVGERRFRAAKEAGLTEVPVVVKDLTDERMMELALLENLQREDLTPIEEASAYATLMKELDITQEELSRRLGKSRSHIANMVRLLSLPKKVIAYMNNGELTMGHGRALLGIKEQSLIEPLVQRIINDQLNVRQVEKIIQSMNIGGIKPPKKEEKKDVFLQEIESDLRDRLGTGVSIQRGKRKGKIQIEFYTNEDLERIIQLLES